MLYRDKCKNFNLKAKLAPVDGILGTYWSPLTIRWVGGFIILRQMKYGNWPQIKSKIAFILFTMHFFSAAYLKLKASQVMTLKGCTTTAAAWKKA